MSRKLVQIVFANVVLVALLFPGALKANDFDPFKNPDAFVSTYLDDNRDRINQLSADSLDTSKSANQRIEALMALQKILPDVALPTMVKLIEDENVEVAAKSAKMLATASMMMNHKMPKSEEASHNDNPFMKYAMARHELIFGALRKSLDDPRKEVRNYAASTLSANSDEKGVAKIIEAANSGAYSQEEVVSYLSFASPEVAGEFMTKYLDSKDSKVLTPVSQYLAESNYRNQVRDKVLLNQEAPLESREECAKLLPTEDLVPLFVSPDTPQDLYSGVLDEYIKRRGNKLTKPQVDHLLKGIERFDLDATEKTKELKGKLEGFKKK